jgi:hypothetical protein
MHRSPYVTNGQYPHVPQWGGALPVSREGDNPINRCDPTPPTTAPGEWQTSSGICQVSRSASFSSIQSSMGGTDRPRTSCGRQSGRETPRWDRDWGPLVGLAAGHRSWLPLASERRVQGCVLSQRRCVSPRRLAAQLQESHAATTKPARRARTNGHASAAAVVGGWAADPIRSGAAAHPSCQDLPTWA